ncbi:MAG TPA: sufurtransferase FdhD [Oceanithermus profundus]|uniref:Sufurtransferase FdhD n=1 Tax=Oceanithermus profundus TaxID=187137 RepID=A0A7C4VF08_9DEIN|nr:sufurtransferase FdhD [Oceanithermus profundus]
MYRYEKGRFHPERFPSPREVELTLVVNGRPTLRLAHSPGEEVELGLGFLWLGGVFDTLDQVRWFRRAEGVLEFEVAGRAGPGVPLRTSSCGMGLVYGARAAQELPFVALDPELPVRMHAALREQAVEYRRTRGIHGAALFTPEGRLLHLSEDIGRHNAVDKIAGRILLEGWSPPFALAVSGRVSGEMAQKAAAMGAVLLTSRTGATQSGLETAERRNLTVCTYVRPLGYRLNTSPGRLLVGAADEVLEPVRVEEEPRSEPGG